MRNYYEILEVDVKASKEIIDKAFKILAKKYHPDTQEEDKKAWAEAKFKEINEAYEILSNKEKRKEYDAELEYAKNSQYEALLIQNENLKKLVEQLRCELESRTTPKDNFNYIPNINTNNENSYNINYENTYYNNPNAQHENPFKKVYYSYSTPIRHRGKDLLAFIITISLIILIGYILWTIPFTKNYLINLYENNAPLKSLIDSIFNIS